ncbi:MAG: sulfite exporter TauE/SafE family protein [Nitrososphaerota archaeon]
MLLYVIPLLGSIGGFLLGLVGFGWGSSTLPLLIILGIEPRHAIGAVVASNTLMCVLGSLRYGNAQYVSWRVAVPMTLGAVSAALLGTAFSTFLPSDLVVAVLGIYLAVGGATVAARPSRQRPRLNGAPSSQWRFALGGAIPGFFEGAYGSGGPAGLLTLVLLRVPIKLAIGSWLTVSLLSQGVASAVYASLGLVDLVLTVLLVLGGVPAIILSSHLTIRKLPDKTVERLAGAAITLLAIRAVAKVIAE